MLQSIVRFVLRFVGSDPVLFWTRLILKAGFAGLVNLFTYGVAF
jgi:hypothetical protein